MELLPDLLDRETTRICYGVRYPKEKAPVLEDKFSSDGLEVERDFCLILYGDYTRDDVLGEWEKMEEDGILKRAHLSGGWGNGMSLELNIYRGLPGNVRFMERTLLDVRKGIEGDPGGIRPRIWFNYTKALEELAKTAGKDTGRPESVTIGELLDVGAPTFWEVYADNLCIGKYEAGPNITCIGKSTSSPFPGTEFELGFFTSELHPDFLEGRADIPISNVTGARGFGTDLINQLLVDIVRGERTARKAYMTNLEKKAYQIQAQGKKIPFSLGKLEKYADDFIDSAGPAKDEVGEIIRNYGKRLTGIQYAAIVYANYQIGLGIFKFPSTVPHAYVKLEDDAHWREAEI